jgi:protoporphyrin/coproporphyrin ferrochelatase
MTGLLLCNLGTPEQPTPAAVRRYLRQFLGDPRVLDINSVGRWLLLNLIILPWRPRKSAAAYRKIWTGRGSPLLYHGEDLARAVQEKLGPSWVVELGMRYQKPSIATALDKMRRAGAERIVVFPLYPQYAASTTGSTVAEVMRLAGRPWAPPALSFVEPFYGEPELISAIAAQGAPLLQSEKPEHVLFSFHGLPERHLHKTDPNGDYCLGKSDCCQSVGASNRRCYRAQCFATARALAARLSLAEGSFSISFQSRLGRAKWIEPYTDRTIVALAQKGCKRLLVFSPAFVADCLETLEEIGIRGRQQFLAAGGESLVLVPSLNASPTWVDAVASLVRRSCCR